MKILFIILKKVLEEDEIDGVKHSKVRWVGWPSKFDTWIPSRIVKNI